MNRKKDPSGDTTEAPKDEVEPVAVIGVGRSMDGGEDETRVEYRGGVVGSIGPADLGLRVEKDIDHDVPGDLRPLTQTLIRQVLVGRFCGREQQVGQVIVGDPV